MTSDEAPSERTTEAPSGGFLAAAIRRPVSVSVGVILVVLFGVLSLAGLPIQLTPDIARPVIDVSTRWPGAAPTEVEAEIIEPQEQALKGLTGLVRMTSSAGPDSARVTLEFEVGTNIDDALVRVSNRLGEVSSYPEAADRPVVSTSDLTGPPLAVVAIRADDGSPVAPYRTWLAEEIIPELERIPGVAGMRHIGGQDTEVHVTFDPDALAERRLRISDLAERVRAELDNVSAGEVTLGKRSFLVRTPLAPDDPSDLEALVLATDDDGAPVTLGDVGSVALGLRRARGVAFSDGRPSMILLLSRESGSNVLEVTQAVRAAVEDLNTRVFAPESLSIEVLSDQTGYITNALDLVRQNLLLGSLLAVFALFVFLRSFGASAIISIAIPVCVFGTALGMSWLGRSINVVSLAGITFAVGMVLDNSIVVLESIDTFRTEGRSAAEAALLGVRTVWGAVLASTLTTIAVFAPIVAWQSEVGQLLRDVAVAVSLAVACSLLVSVWVIPSLAARLLKPRRADETSTGDDDDDDADDADGAPVLAGALSFGARVRDRLVAAAGWIIADTRRSLLVVALVVGGAAATAVTLAPPLEYLPTGNRNLIFGVLVPPPGYATEEFERMGRAMQDRIAPHVGQVRDGVPAIHRSFFVGDGSFVFAGAVARDPEAIPQLLPFLRRVQGEVPGTIGFTNQASLFGRAVGGGRSIELNIVGSDLPTLTGVAAQMMGLVKRAIPGTQVRPVPGLDPGAPELQIRPRRRRAAQLDMRGEELGQIVDSLVDGRIIGELSPDSGYALDVVLRAERADGSSIEDPGELMDVPIVTASGQVVPLAALAERQDTLGPTVIQRIERRRAVTLQISPPESVPIETAIAQVRAEVVGPLLQSGEIPAGVSTELSGAAGDLAEATTQFAEALVLAVIICFLLLAALFEDFLAPLVVLASLPLAAAGGMISLILVDRSFGPVPLDLLTALGFLILIGVVVNNAILVVDGALARLRDGRELTEATAEAVRMRVRPIFMTTVTSLAGLLPMVLSSGSGTELYRGVGAIVLGGLALSSVLIVFVVPALFVLLWRARQILRPSSA